MTGFGQPFGAPGYRVIDSDQHINEPPDLWTSRVAAKLREPIMRPSRGCLTSDDRQDQTSQARTSMSSRTMRSMSATGTPFVIAACATAVLGIFLAMLLATFQRKIAAGAPASGIAAFAENCKVGRI